MVNKHPTIPRINLAFHTDTAEQEAHAGCSTKRKWEHKRKGRPHLDARERHPELLLGDDDGPLLPAVAEQLLGVDEAAAGEDLVPDALRGGALGGDDGLLGAVEVGHEDSRRLRLGARGRGRGGEAAELDGAGRVGVLGLAAVALREDLHRRGLPRVQRAVLHHHPGNELEHLSALARRLLPRRQSPPHFAPTKILVAALDFGLVGFDAWVSLKAPA